MVKILKCKISKTNKSQLVKTFTKKELQELSMSDKKIDDEYIYGSEEFDDIENILIDDIDYKRRIENKNKKSNKYQNNKEKLNQKNAEYRKNNKEKEKKRKAEWYQKNKEHILQQRIERKEELKQKQAEYRKNNKEKINQQQAEYRKKQKNKEKVDK